MYQIALSTGFIRNYPLIHVRVDVNLLGFNLVGLIEFAVTAWGRRTGRRQANERIFNRLQSGLPITPLFVSRDDQVQGLTRLLLLGVRVLTLVEFTVRRSLQQEQAKLADLHPENRSKGNRQTYRGARPKGVFGDLADPYQGCGRTGNQTLADPTVSRAQQDILQRLGLEASLYRQLEIQNNVEPFARLVSGGHFGVTADLVCYD